MNVADPRHVINVRVVPAVHAEVAPGHQVIVDQDVAHVGCAAGGQGGARVTGRGQDRVVADRRRRGVKALDAVAVRHRGDVVHVVDVGVLHRGTGADLEPVDRSMKIATGNGDVIEVGACVVARVVLPVNFGVDDQDVGAAAGAPQSARSCQPLPGTY